MKQKHYALLASVLLTLLVFGSWSSVAAQCFPTQTFTTGGSTSDYFLPAGPDAYDLQIIARGADGGRISSGVGTFVPGGTGATITATYEVPSGAKLRSFVGETENSAATLVGGGGSAVVLADTAVLIAAGGGGGPSGFTGAVAQGGQANTNSVAAEGAPTTIGTFNDATGGGGFNADAATSGNGQTSGGKGGTLTAIGAGGTPVAVIDFGGSGWGGGGASATGAAGAGGGGYRGGDAGQEVAGQRGGKGGDSFVVPWGTVVSAVPGVDAGADSPSHGLIEISCLATIHESTQNVASSGTTSFGNVPVDIAFSGVTSAGDVTVKHVVGAVSDVGSIPRAFVYNDHFVVIADPGPSFASAELRIQVDDIASPTFPDPAGVTLYQRPTPGSGAFVEVPTTYEPGTNEIVGTGITSFSEFALAGNEGLPVELLSFNASVDGNSVRLRWTTLTETNNAGFEILTAYSDETFRKVAYVPGNGTTREQQKYVYKTADMRPGRHAFKLKQIDFDGAFEYSEEIEAVIEVPGAFVLEDVYPNPFNPFATVRFGASTREPVRVALYDAIGRLVAELFSGPLEPHQMREVRIYGYELPSGTYFVRMEGSDVVETKSLTLLK